MRQDWPSTSDGDAGMNVTENRKLMELLFAAVAAGDRASFFDHISDDVVMRITGRYSWSRTFRGKEALSRELYGYLATLLAEGRKTLPLRFIAEGDHVVVEAVGEMRTRDGIPYNNEYCLIYRLSGGKIVEIREYCDSALCERVLGPFPQQAGRAAD
jgi:ketosteroid isomerase-like protein